MKVVIFSGSHSRHLYVNQEVSKQFEESLIVIQKREPEMPRVPNFKNLNNKNLYTKHFKNRNLVEKKFFGKLNYKKVFPRKITIYVSASTLNSKKIIKEIKKFDPDFAFIFGTNLISPSLIRVLPRDKINLHLGLSPWYKGAATLFWPFYFLKPQYAGITFHEINNQPDSGEIIHQNVPKLKKGDKMHEVAAKCVLQAAKDIKLLISFWKKNKKFIYYKQKTSGRVWRNKDFHVSHLKLIYELYKHKIVDSYLKGELDKKKPNLVSCLNQK